MKLYEKPSIEVISMKTAENIADDYGLIKTIYTRAAGAESTTGIGGYTQMADPGRYNSDAINNS